MIYDIITVKNEIHKILDKFASQWNGTMKTSLYLNGAKEGILASVCVRPEGFQQITMVEEAFRIPMNNKYSEEQLTSFATYTLNRILETLQEWDTTELYGTTVRLLKQHPIKPIAFDYPETPPTQ